MSGHKPRSEELSPEELLGTHGQVDWSSVRAQRVRRRIDEQLMGSAQPTLVRGRYALVAAAAIAAILVAVLPSGSNKAGRTVFTDGSAVQAIMTDSRFKVIRETSEEVLVGLDYGQIDVEVEPNPERRFHVQAGKVRVTVLGTRFTVQQIGVETSVQVTRGRVRVSGVQDAVVLTAGQQAKFKNGVYHRAEASLPQTATAATPGAPSVKRSALRPRKASERRARPRRASPKERFASESSGGGGRSRTPDGVDDLLRAADRHRLAGQPEAALRALQQIESQHSQDPRAPLALFTQGRILLDDLDQPQRAARIFRKMRRLYPRLGLTEDAWAREVEAWARAKEPARARAEAEGYLEAYPQGHHAAKVRRYGKVPIP